MHQDNAFITLTYRQEDLPADGSLNVRHFQNFMKYLRRDHGAGIRFFHCGEYGEQNLRPHYHACIFGHDFTDKKLWSVNPKTKHRIYRSEQLEKLWPFGHSSVGSVTFQSAGYVARYIMKKITGEAARDHYWSGPDQDGVIHELKPEYVTMSRRPGIGRDWFTKYWRDIYPSDYCSVKLQNGSMVKHPVPRYYDKLLEEHEPEMFDQVQAKRLEFAAKHRQDNTDERLRTREFCKAQQLRRLTRPLEIA